jgi:S-adenosylmethionine:tRNA ribosyltransferase-isomerase
LKTSDFDYVLPPELIAQTPLELRDQSRLLVLNRDEGSFDHHRFFEITDYLCAGDVLVFNDSRVIPARLSGRKTGGEGKLEMLLLRRLEPGVWEALVKPAKRVKVGTKIELAGDVSTVITGEVVGIGEDGIITIRFSDEALLSSIGTIPLPPYIHIPLEDTERYQTVYARIPGSAAAPTAGLHFTPELIKKMQNKGVECLFVTLHVGLDTFRPVREEDPLKHVIHREYGVLEEETAQRLTRAKAEGRRIIPVGTTSMRLLEAAAQTGSVQAFAGWVDLFILPGYKFRMADAMITNFHMPRTTLVMLVSAFAGKDLLMQAYQEAINEKYRFYSFGDAMLIL